MLWKLQKGFVDHKTSDFPSALRRMDYDLTAADHKIHVSLLMDPNKPCSLIRVGRSQKPAVLGSNNATLPIFYTFLVGGPVEFIEKY